MLGVKRINMEFTYRKDSLPKSRKIMLFRGALLLAFSLVLLLSYLTNLEWYFSLLPGVIILIFSLGDLFGVKTMEKYRGSMKILTSDEGITVHVHGVDSPVFWPWNQVSIQKEKTKKGVLTSFTINTGDKHIKEWAFTDDIESFSTLYKQVSSHDLA